MGIKLRIWDLFLDFVLNHHPAVKNCNLVNYAKHELELAGFYNEDACYGDLVPKAVLRSVRIFSIEGHSGMSASLVNSLVSKVCMFEPLTPLSGKDEEWIEVGDDIWQNKCASHVFKTSNGAYDINGRIFREPNGACYTSIDSRTKVIFPYTPHTVYVDVGE